MTRTGTTLIEVLITMTVLSILAGVTVLAVRRFPEPNPDDPKQILADSQRVAAATGRTISVSLTIDSINLSASVRPDGSIVGDSALAFERFTGLPRDAR